VPVVLAPKELLLLNTSVEYDPLQTVTKDTDCHDRNEKLTAGIGSGITAFFLSNFSGFFLVVLGFEFRASCLRDRHLNA
jgi:hypothetical protein